MSRRLTLSPHWSIVALLMLSLAAPALAQNRPRRTTRPEFIVSVNGGVAAGAKSFTQTASLSVNAETGDLSANHGAKSAPTFDIGGGVRLTRQLSVMVAFSSLSRKASSAVTANLPHPLLFNQPRAVQGSITGVAHKETAVHVDATWELPGPSGLDLAVMAGPTFFSVRQNLVSTLEYSETYPFDSATFTGAQTSRLSKSVVGFNVGLDLSRPVASRVSIGGLIRYSGATAKLSGSSVGAASVKVGGVEAAGGIRLRF